AVVAQPGPGHAALGQRADVGFRIALARHPFDAQWRQYLLDLRQRGRLQVAGAGVEAVDVAGAEIAFHRDDVVGDVRRMLVRIGAAAPQALLLVGEGDHADAARRLQRLEQRAGGHGDSDAGGIVDRAGAVVPGVQVAADQHHFLRPLAAGDFADDVLRGVFAVPAAI